MITFYMVVCQTPKHLYFGETEAFDARVLKHQGGKGAMFIQRHGYKACYAIRKCETREQAKCLERYWVRRLRNMHGFTVAGGGYTWVP